MKTFSIARNFKSIAGKLMLGLIIALVFSSISVTPVFSKDKRMEGRYEQRGHDRDRHMQSRPYGYYGHRDRDYYPPPPVFYAPPPPPGIGIFFPPIFIRP